MPRANLLAGALIALCVLAGSSAVQAQTCRAPADVVATIQAALNESQDARLIRFVMENPDVVKMLAESDLQALARRFHDRTIGMWARTDEDFAYGALGLANLSGQIGGLNTEVAKILLEEGDDADEVQAWLDENPSEGALRFVVDEEMSGSEFDRAIAYLEVGRDRFDSSGWEYFLEGIVDSMEGIVELARDRPVLVLATAGTAIVVGVLAPVVAVGVGAAVLIYGVYEAGTGLYEAATAETDEEFAHGLIDAGHGTGLALIASPALLGAKTVVGATRAARDANGVLQSTKAFIIYESAIHHFGRGAAAAAAAEEGPAALARTRTAAAGAGDEAVATGCKNAACTQSTAAAATTETAAVVGGTEAAGAGVEAALVGSQEAAANAALAVEEAAEMAVLLRHVGIAANETPEFATVTRGMIDSDGASHVRRDENEDGASETDGDD